MAVLDGLGPLPPGTVVRPGSHADLDAVLAVIRAAEEDERGAALTTRTDVAADWARPGMHLDRDLVVVRAGGRVVASAEEYRGRAFGHVHPDARGRGIGTAIAQWSEQHASAAGLARVGQTIPATADHAHRLLRGRGYEPRWDAWILQLPLTGDLGSSLPPDGVVIRSLRRPSDDRALYEVIEQAFDTWADRDPALAFEDWQASLLDRVEDQDLVLVAEEDDHLVGAALCFPEGDEGWIDQLAVRPDRWGRGIAQALLHAAFRRFAVRGLSVASLSTDSRTGALGLYEHVGMRVTSTFTHLSLVLDVPLPRPGDDPVPAA